jgi:broad specificity phosphatase PhoE
MKRLFFVRHGESEANAASIIAGHFDTPLNDTGREQARMTGIAIKDTNTQVDYIVASPLKRALETAQIIASQIEFELEAIEQNKLVMERFFGILENTDGVTARENYKLEDIDFVEGVERLEAMQQRAQAALEYVQSLTHDNILVVSHGAFGRAFRRAVHKLPHTHEYEVYDPISNAAFLELI